MTTNDDTILVRVNTRISKQINDWLDNKSKMTGVPKSALIHLALESHIQQQTVVDELPRLYQELSRLKEGSKTVSE